MKNENLEIGRLRNPIFKKTSIMSLPTSAGHKQKIINHVDKVAPSERILLRSYERGFADVEYRAMCVLRYFCEIL